MMLASPPILTKSIEEVEQKSIFTVKTGKYLKWGLNRTVIQETLSRSTIEAAKVLCANKQPSGMDPIIEFLQND
ncbi:hypothetical protein CR513_07349, partial [Mucuna pruriens]